MESNFFNGEIYCVITTALRSRDGSAVVSLHFPDLINIFVFSITSVLLKSVYIHPRLVWSQVCGSCSRRRWEVWHTGQAEVFRKKLNYEIKDE